MKTYKIASIPGDGVGKETVPQAERVLNAIAELHGGIAFDFTSFPWSCEYYLEHGTMMPDDGLERLQHFDALFLGAVGNQNSSQIMFRCGGCSSRYAGNLNR